MAYTFDETIVSDLHKDAFGFRPREFFWEEWNAASDAQRQEIWDDLLLALDRAVEFERQQQEAAIVDFRAEVARMIELGAKDEHQAKKWIIQSLGADEMDLLYGGSWVCYELGLPYSMRQMFEQACREILQEINNG